MGLTINAQSYPVGEMGSQYILNSILLGWDISSMNLADAMRRAEVLDWPLQEQLQRHMVGLKPRPSIYNPEFIAANQRERADNVLTGSWAEQVSRRRKVTQGLVLDPFSTIFICAAGN